MKNIQLTILILFNFLLLWTVNNVNCQNDEEDCEKEEEAVEICARNFLMYSNDTMPETEAEMDKFCRNNKENERCLQDHSNKCLSHSANQAIMELIRSISSKNQAICSNKQRRNVYMRANQCLNRQRSHQCYQTFVHQTHGIHQFSQVEKIPIICCNYHEFLSCIQNEMKFCSNDLKNTLLRLLQNYSGETLNYVCGEYKNSNKCATIRENRIQNNNNNNPVHNEAIPKSFFSLIVKIYLS